MGARGDAVEVLGSAAATTPASRSSGACIESWAGRQWRQGGREGRGGEGLVGRDSGYGSGMRGPLEGEGGDGKGARLGMKLGERG